MNFRTNPSIKKTKEKIPATLDEINKEFPIPDDTDCKFSNGGWCVKRTESFYKNYKNCIESYIGFKHKIDYPPWSYAWFRTLNDGNYPEYTLALRVLCICPVCFREWGQRYFVEHCEHKSERQ